LAVLLLLTFAGVGVAWAQEKGPEANPQSKDAIPGANKEAIKEAIKGANKGPDDWQKAQLNKDDPRFKAIRDRTPIGELPDNPEEFDAFVEVLKKAHGLPPELLERALANVGYASLTDDGERVNYLRSFLRIKGKEVYLGREVESPAILRKAGIAKVYTAWVEMEQSPEKRVQVIFCDLPKGLDTISTIPHAVEFEGYYFKLMEYEQDLGGANEGVKVKKFAPLLLARTIRVLDEDAPEQPNLREAERVRLDKESPEWTRVIDERPLVGRDQNIDEYTAFNRVVLKTQDFSQEQLAKYSMRQVVFADMVSERRKPYMRELVHVEGTLVRLHKVSATDRLRATSPVKDLYEGWMVHESSNKDTVDKPLIEVLFTDLPPDLKVGDHLHSRVAFDGYYFKLLAYESGETEKIDASKKVWRKAPLLIGRSIEVLEPESTSPSLILAVLVLFGTLAAGMVGVYFWVRRSDKKVHEQTQEALTKLNPFEEKTSEAPPAVEPGNAWDRMRGPTDG
jgi:hypothetical protein